LTILAYKVKQLIESNTS